MISPVQKPTRALHGQRLAALTEPRGVKAALAKFLGVDQGQITRWIDGATTPGADHLMGMIEFLGVSSWYLFGIEEPPEMRIATALRQLPAADKERTVRQFEAMLAASVRYQPLMPGDSSLPPEMRTETEEFLKLAEERIRQRAAELRDAQTAPASNRKQAGKRPRRG